MRFGPRRSFFYEKASYEQNFNQEKFWFQMISKPFDQSALYLKWWQNNLIDILMMYFLLTSTQKSKVKFLGQTGNRLNLCSYLKTYLTHKHHTWYQDIT